MRDYCRCDVAAALKDPGICYSEKDRDIEYLCLLRVAAAMEDESLCRDIKSIDLRDDCLINVALSKEDINICDMVSSGRGDSCIVSLLSKAESHNICERSKSKTHCLMLAADHFKNGSICTLIEEDYMRDECAYSLARSTKNTQYCGFLSSNEKAAKCRTEVIIMSQMG